MSNERLKKIEDLSDNVRLSDLQYILEVNKKAIELQLDVKQSNDAIIDSLEYFKDTLKKIEEELSTIKLHELEKQSNQKIINLNDENIQNKIVDILQEFKEKILLLESVAKTNGASVDKINDRLRSISEEKLDVIKNKLDAEIKPKLDKVSEDFLVIRLILGLGILQIAWQILQFLIFKK